MSTLALSVQRTVSLALLALLNPCVGPCTEWEYLNFQTKADVQRIPFDQNLQGLKWSVSPFKPVDLVTGAKMEVEKGDKRFAFRGSGVGDNNFAVFGGLRGRGLYSLGAELSIDSTQGLRHLETTSWVYARYDGDPTTEFQVNLQYSAALDNGEASVPGLIARAYMDDTLLDSVEYPGVNSLEVRLLQEDGMLHFLSRPATYTELEEGSFAHAEPFDTIYTMARANPTGFEVGFGAFGIDKGGDVFFDMPWFVGPDLGPEPGTDETFVFDAFGDIGSCLIVAKELLEDDPDLSAISLARTQVSNARSTAINTMFFIDSAIKAGDFDAQTEAKTANKIGKQTYKKLDKILGQLDKMLAKEKINSGQLNSICKSLQDLTDRSVVGMANMLGVKASNYKQIDRGMSIAPGDLPDIF